MKYKEGFDRQKVAEQHGFDWWLSQSAEFMKSDAGYLKKQEAMKEFAPNYNVTPKNARLPRRNKRRWARRSAPSRMWLTSSLRKRLWG